MPKGRYKLFWIKLSQIKICRLRLLMGVSFRI